MRSTRGSLSHHAAAAVALAVSATLAKAATTITSPFRGVTHIVRDEPAGAVVPRQVVIHLLAIDLKDPGVSFLATPGNGADPGEFTGQTTAQFVSQYGLQAAINGDFFSSAGTGPGGEIYRDVSNLAASGGNVISAWSGGTAAGAINITADNDAKIVKPASATAGTTTTSPAVTLWNAVGGNMRILNNGNVLATSTAVNPLTCVGVTGDTLYLFTVDGRQSGYSDGMSMIEAATFLRDQYGVQDALNFDGGGSTTMVLANPSVTVVNQPSDGTLRTNGNNLGLFARSWQEWNKNADGNWSTASNWSGGVPNSVGAAARFATSILAARTITTSSAVTVGTMTFEGSQSYTILGAGANVITLDVPVREAAIDLKSASTQRILAPLTIADATDINVVAGGTLELGGGLSNPAAVAVTKLDAGTLIVGGLQSHATGTNFKMNAGTLVLNTDLGAGVSLKPNDGLTQINVPQNLTTLQLSSPAVVRVAAGGGNTIKTGNVQTPAGSTLDLADNDLIIDYTGASTLGTWDGSSYTAKTGLIARGRGNDGHWDHSGINSSTAAASAGLTALGIAEASDVLHLGLTQTALWSGQTVDSSALLIKYTYAGDANLDGKLNVDDYIRIDTSIANGLSGWWNGDFNYDGKINIDDYTIIDGNIPNAPPGVELGSAEAVAIPEPASLAWMLVTSPLLLARRRQQRSNT